MKIPLYLTLAAVLAAGLSIDTQAADAPIIRETYTCSFHDGKDMGDLMAARDFYLKQMEKAGQTANEAFVWTPYKANVDFDFLWANNSPDLVAFGQGADAFNNSAEGAAAMERFNSVAQCSSSLSVRTQFYQAPGEFSGNHPPEPVIVNAYACNLRSGSTPDDIEDLLVHLTSTLGSLGLSDGMAAYAAQPMAGGGPNSSDIYLYGVQGSMEDWAVRTTTLQGSADGSSLGRHFNAVLDCNQALFFAQRVVPPAE